MTCNHCFHMNPIFHDNKIVKTFKICCTCATVYDTWFIDYGFTNKEGNRKMKSCKPCKHEIEGHRMCIHTCLACMYERKRKKELEKE